MSGDCSSSPVAGDTCINYSFSEDTYNWLIGMHLNTNDMTGVSGNVYYK